MNASVVFDSWAVIAWIRDEPAASRVDDMIRQAETSSSPVLMSWINAGEVYYMLVRKNSQRIADEFLTRLPSLPFTIVPDENAVIEAAQLKASRRTSYADAFATALALRENAVLATGDPELRELRDILRVEWLGE